jgi:hypothetical protein
MRDSRISVGLSQRSWVLFSPGQFAVSLAIAIAIAIAIAVAGRSGAGRAGGSAP